MKTKTARQTANIYAVVGSDESAVKTAASELAVQLTPADAGDFGVETIDGCADNADQAAARIRSAIEALQTLPFFGGGKLVWLKNANFLGDSKLGGAAAVQEALEQLSAALEGDLGAGEVKFLLSAPEVDKRRSFYKALAKRAELQVFDKLDASRSGWEEEATDLVQSLGKQRQLRFDGEALDLFVLLTGGDTRTINNELEKLDLFLGAKERQITLEDVRTLVPISRGGVIFELGNALAARHLDRALSLVRRLLDQGESAIGILLVAIIPTVRNLLLAKDLMQRHRLPRPSAPFFVHLDLESSPGRSDRTSPAQKRRLDQRLRARHRGDAGASLRRGTADRGSRSLPDGEPANRHQPARSRTDPEPGRGEAARAHLKLTPRLSDALCRRFALRSAGLRVAGKRASLTTEAADRPHATRSRLQAVHLLARGRPDPRNVPAHAAEGLHDRDDEHDEKADIHHGPDEPEEKGKHPANRRDAGQDAVNNSPPDPEEEPRGAKDDRLHRVEANERIASSPGCKR